MSKQVRLYISDKTMQTVRMMDGRLCDVVLLGEKAFIFHSSGSDEDDVIYGTYGPASMCCLPLDANKKPKKPKKTPLQIAAAKFIRAADNFLNAKVSVSKRSDRKP